MNADTMCQNHTHSVSLTYYKKDMISLLCRDIVNVDTMCVCVYIIRNSIFPCFYIGHIICLKTYLTCFDGVLPSSSEGILKRISYVQGHKDGTSFVAV